MALLIQKPWFYFWESPAKQKRDCRPWTCKRLLKNADSQSLPDVASTVALYSPSRSHSVGSLELPHGPTWSILGRPRMYLFYLKTNLEPLEGVRDFSIPL